MNEAFFLTRQNADLMEELIRELNTEPGLFLLVGDTGAGKTRMLEELAQSRLGDSRIYWIDLQAGGDTDGVLVDSSALIEESFSKAQEGDIVIADHFESALRKTRHQLFLSWTTEGVEKKLSFIISGNREYFTEICQLVQQYQVPVKSFQLMPMTTEEVTGFLGLYLYPDHSEVNLVIPPLLREQLASSNGNIGEIIDIAERAGDQITIAARKEIFVEEKLSQPKRKRKPLIAVTLLAMVLVLVGVWLYFSSQSDFLGVQSSSQSSTTSTQVASSEIDRRPEIVEKKTAEPADSVIAAETEPSDVGIVIVADEVVQIEVMQKRVESPVDDSVASTEFAEETTPVTNAQSVAEVDEPAGELESRAVDDQFVPVIDAAIETAAAVPTGPGRLEHDLQSSLAWALRSSRKKGSLQIMMLSRELFDEQVYYEYLDGFAKRGVDTGMIRIFPTTTGGREVYSVVYGEFDSWQAASDSRNDVPRVLREYAPIPRSVGGLLDEMRLEAGN